jgi:hypothetical protein
VLLSGVVFPISGCKYRCTCVSILCNLSLLILYIWYLSDVKMFSFFFIFIMSIVSVIEPHVCPVFNIRFEYPGLPLLILIACICSLYLVCLSYIFQWAVNNGR